MTNDLVELFTYYLFHENILVNVTYSTLWYLNILQYDSLILNEIKNSTNKFKVENLLSKNMN